MDPTEYMRKALRLAAISAEEGEVPVGAVVVRDGQIIATGRNRREKGKNALYHAEIEAIDAACKALGGWRLPRCQLYVTLEPCPMCAGAIINARIEKVWFGAYDKKAGSVASVVDLFSLPYNHKPETEGGVLEEECRVHHEAFFKWITTGRPFVLLKMAETLDGKIAAANGDSKWVTSEIARERVAYLRRLSDAVLAGAETFRTDSPRFTARTPDGTVLKTPRRIVATHHPEILSGAGEGWESAVLDTPEDWREFLVRLGRENVTMLLIEGGGELAASAIRARSVDKIEFHIAPKLLGGRGSRPVLGGPDPASLSEAVRLDRLRVSELGCDLRIEAYPLYPES